MDYKKHSKKEIQEFAIVEADETVQEGRENILDLYIDCMAKIEYYTALSKNYHASAMEEFETHGEKEVMMHGRKISKFEAGVKYDFSNCGHIDLDALERVKKDVEFNIKGFKEQIKFINGKQDMLSEDGEVFTVIPPTKTSTTKLKLQY